MSYEQVFEASYG